MQRLFAFLIELAYWLAIAASPSLIGLAMSAALFVYRIPVWPAPIIVGVIAGVVWAEWARRHYGCSNYIAQILATPDL
jgi:hypothetical protein